MFEDYCDWEEALEEAKEELGYNEDWKFLCNEAKHKLKKRAMAQHRFYLNSKWWKTMEQKVLKRDNYTCQNCIQIIPIILRTTFKNINQKLIKQIDYIRKATEVHHYSYKNKNNKEELYDCISLCSFCHKLLHSKYYNIEAINEERKKNIIFAVYKQLMRLEEVLKIEKKQHNDFLDSITIKPIYKRWK